ncbi:hypothetical protein Hanom_Chr07g00648411 [Helianthus anomalus]
MDCQHNENRHQTLSRNKYATKVGTFTIRKKVRLTYFKSDVPGSHGQSSTHRFKRASTTVINPRVITQQRQMCSVTTAAQPYFNRVHKTVNSGRSNRV